MWEHSSRFISLTGIFALWAILQKMKVLPGITNGSLPGHIAVLEMNTYITHKKEVVDKKSKPLITLPPPGCKKFAKTLEHSRNADSKK
jgi:hypothetical protein